MFIGRSAFGSPRRLREESGRTGPRPAAKVAHTETSAGAQRRVRSKDFLAHSLDAWPCAMNRARPQRTMDRSGTALLAAGQETRGMIRYRARG